MRHFLQLLLFTASQVYPVAQISVQFIFRSIIGIEALRGKLYLELYLELRRFRNQHLWSSRYIFSRSSSVKLYQQ